MAKHQLSDRTVRNAKPRTKPAKPYRLFDGDGLALWVSPTGARSWQLRYRHDGKAQTLTLGKLERLSLAEARIEADKARKLADKGEHLTSVKRVARVTKATTAAQTFDRIAAAWAATEARRKQWSADYVDEVAQSLRNHLHELDRLPITAIQATTVAPILHRLERSAPAMEPRAARRLHAIMDYAVEIGALTQNPLPRRRSSKAERRNYAAVVDLPSLGEILRAASAKRPRPSVERAHLLLAFTAQRIGEVIGAQWSEFDLQAGVWSIPRDRMKRKDAERGPHDVPLPPRLLALLREWRQADGDAALYVCPARNRRKPIIADAVGKYYRDTLALAGAHSPHSWRSAFSTVCREAQKLADVVESQLDHQVGNNVASAYDRAKRLQPRRELVTWYEATLIAARDGAEVIAMRTR